jgi:antitoxin component of MazEF toxin-antitoxin module
MAVKLLRWGNSAGIRLSAPVLEAAGLRIGSYVTVRALDSGEIRIRPLDGLNPVEKDHSAPVQTARILDKW